MNTSQTVLWTEQTASLATHARVTQGEWSATGVSIDSRTIKVGDLFIALQGPNYDGHQFVGEALESGAVAACVSTESFEGKGLIVQDTLQALCALGQRRRQESQAHFVAVTGSVGKTGTKDMLIHVFKKHGRTYGTEGNVNNHYGVPLSLARVPRECDYVVLELGMRAPGEIQQLAQQVRPEVAVITTIEAAHLEFFSSVAAIADAKAEVFMGMKDHSESTAILNQDNAYFERLRDHAREQSVKNIWSFGKTEGSNARLLSCEVGRQETRIVAQLMGKEYAYRLGMLGEHWAMNSLAVLLGVYALGGDVSQACECLATQRAPEQRGMQYVLAVDHGQALLIDDSYNANPKSMAAALRVLKTIPERRIAVLGDMRELGAHSAQYHRQLLSEVINADIKRVFCCGTDMKHLYQALDKPMQAGFCSTSTCLAEKVVREIRPGDVILVKGSRDSHMKTIVSALLKQFRA